jgi:hypothetical protein
MSGSVLKRALAGVALGALVFAGGSAQAANYVLDLTGSFLDLQTNSFTFNGKFYETGALELSGFTPFELADGDTVEVSVTITDGPFVTPVRQEMFFGLNFADISGGAQPTTSTAMGTFSFDGGPPIDVGCSNCTSFIRGQAGTPLTFTTLAAQGAFTMDTPYAVNSITVSYQVSDAIPEPGAWALMILGFGGAGAMLRRHRRGGFAAA